MKEEIEAAKEVVSVVKDLVEAVPIYEDVARPAAKQVGKSLETIAKTIHIALLPLTALVWSYENIGKLIESGLSEKLKNIPADKIKTPQPNIAVPAIEALRYTANEPSLREMYINLLAASMNVDTAKNAHPAYVEIIKQLTPDEAKILEKISTIERVPAITLSSFISGAYGEEIYLRHFSLIGNEVGCEHPELTSSYIVNLCRLGLLEIYTETNIFEDQTIFNPLTNHPEVIKLSKEIEKDGKRHATSHPEAILLTDFGKQFCIACTSS